MKTTRTFYGVFGNKYELDILSEEKIDEIIENIDEMKLLRTLIEEHHGDHTHAYLNISTGEIEYYTFTGNTDLQEKGHLIALESIRDNLEEGLEVEDFLDSDEIEKAGDDKWEFIRELEDYQERLVDAWIHYYNGLDMTFINNEIGKIYHPDF